MNNLDLTTIVSIVAGILCLLTIGVVLKRRSFQEWTVRLLILYTVVLCLLELVRAVSRLGWLAFLTDAILAQVVLYGVLILSLLFLHLRKEAVQLLYRQIKVFLLHHQGRQQAQHFFARTAHNEALFVGLGDQFLGLHRQFQTPDQTSPLHPDEARVLLFERLQFGRQVLPLLPHAG